MARRDDGAEGKERDRAVASGGPETTGSGRSDGARARGDVGSESHRGERDAGGRIRTDVAAEIDSHFEGTVELLMERGMSEEDAWAEARRRFGDVQRHSARLERIDRKGRRKRRMRAWVDATRQHLAFALRGIRQSPGFAAAVVVILALGIGANVTMFEVVDRLLLSPPDHVVAPEEVRRLFVSRIGFNDRLFTSSTLTYPDFEDLTAVEAFESTAAYTRSFPVTMGGGEDAVRVRRATATASFFPLLGVEPAFGRFFQPEEDAVGAPVPVVVLGHGFWQRYFGGDPEVLGTTLRIGPATWTVIGVAPPGFTGAELEPVDVWMPLRTAQAITTDGDRWASSRSWWWLQAIGRLAPGRDVQVAEEQATAAHRSGRADVDDYDPEARIVSASLIAADRPEVPPRPDAAPSPDGGGVDEAAVSRWLAGVSVIVLLIACANVANLMLARAVRWRRDTALRMALGSGRGRLLGQYLTESVVLALLGAGAALLVARWGGTLVKSVLLPDVAFGGGLGLRLLLFTAAAGLFTAVAAGLVPALEASRPDPAAVLRAGSRGSGPRSRARTVLLVAQAALSVVLLVGAGLFVRSLGAVGSLDLGFDPEGLLYARLEPESGADVEELYRQAVERLEPHPLVAAAAYSKALPFRSSIGVDVAVEGLEEVPDLPSGGPYVYGVTAGFFDAMDLRIVRGRGIELSDDAAGAPSVAVVNETFADVVWPEDEPLGRCLLIGLDSDPGSAPCTRVVGVVENSRRQQVADEEAQMMYYLPATQFQTSSPSALLIRTNVAPGIALPDLDRLLASLDVGVRYVDMAPFATLFENQLRGWRLGASMFSAFGLLALVMAAVGLHSVLAFTVAQRRPELGIRAALGATASRMVTMVARDAVGTAALGLAVGVAAAWVLAPRMEEFLYRVSPRDPVVYGGVTVVLLTVAALAAVIPARRATRVDPNEALRSE